MYDRGNLFKLKFGRTKWRCTDFVSVQFLVSVSAEIFKYLFWSYTFRTQPSNWSSLVYDQNTCFGLSFKPNLTETFRFFCNSVFHHRFGRNIKCICRSYTIRIVAFFDDVTILSLTSVVVQGRIQTWLTHLLILLRIFRKLSPSFFLETSTKMWHAMMVKCVVKLEVFCVFCHNEDSYVERASLQFYQICLFLDRIFQHFGTSWNH